MAEDARVYGSTGLPGAGKSYSMVEFVIIPFLKAGKKIITNIPLHHGLLFQIWDIDSKYYDNLTVIPDVTNPDTGEIEQPIADLFVPSADPEKNSLLGCIVVFDEIQTTFPFDDTNRRNSKLSTFREFLSHHRHYGTTIYWASQDITFVHITIRRLTSILYVHDNVTAKHGNFLSSVLKKNSGYGYYRRRMFALASGEMRDNIPIDDKTHRFSNRIFASYTSFAADGSGAQMVQPMPLYLRRAIIALLVLFLIMLVAVFFTVKQYKSKFKRSELSSPVVEKVSKTSEEELHVQKQSISASKDQVQYDSYLCFFDNCDFYRAGEFVGSGPFSQTLFDTTRLDFRIISPVRPYSLDGWDSSAASPGIVQALPATAVGLDR
jgi:zona occludens toxin